MTANVILEQFVRQKQLASDYLSQADETSSILNGLINKLLELKSIIQEYLKSLHNLFDKRLIPIKDFEDLNIYQTEIKQLQQALKDNLFKASTKLKNGGDYA